jgi:hypothetical protein
MLPHTEEETAASQNCPAMIPLKEEGIAGGERCPSVIPQDGTECQRMLPKDETAVMEEWLSVLPLRKDNGRNGTADQKRHSMVLQNDEEMTAEEKAPSVQLQKDKVFVTCLGAGSPGSAGADSGKQGETKHIFITLLSSNSNVYFQLVSDKMSRRKEKQNDPAFSQPSGVCSPMCRRHFRKARGGGFR